MFSRASPDGHRPPRTHPPNHIRPIPAPTNAVPPTSTMPRPAMRSGASGERKPSRLIRSSVHPHTHSAPRFTTPQVPVSRCHRLSLQLQVLPPGIANMNAPWPLGNRGPTVQQSPSTPCFSTSRTTRSSRQSHLLRVSMATMTLLVPWPRAI